MSEPIDNLFSTSEMSSVFSPKAHVRGMLAFEAALARAEARTGNTVRAENYYQYAEHYFRSMYPDPKAT